MYRRLPTAEHPYDRTRLRRSKMDEKSINLRIRQNRPDHPHCHRRRAHCQRTARRDGRRGHPVIEIVTMPIWPRRIGRQEAEFNTMPLIGLPPSSRAQKSLSDGDLWDLPSNVDESELLRLIDDMIEAFDTVWPDLRCDDEFLQGLFVFICSRPSSGSSTI